MKFRKKHFFIITILLILLAGIYASITGRSGASSNLSISNEIQTDFNISDLMASMNIYQIKEPKNAPDFNLMSLGDNKVQLSQYRGKVVLLSFWATW